MFEKLAQWADMPLEKRYNLLLGLIIVILSFTINKQHNENNNIRKACKKDKLRLQEQIDDAKDESLIYLRKMDLEYRSLLRELNNLKNEKTDN